MTLWARFGDGDDYHDVGGIVELIDELKNLGIKRIEPCNKFGVEADEYRGQNYISLYFGDDVETPSRGLSWRELELVNSHIG